VKVLCGSERLLSYSPTLLTACVCVCVCVSAGVGQALLAGEGVQRPLGHSDAVQRPLPQVSE
jgi:hypothetical protein